MFDDPTALRSDSHDSTALGKYLFVPSMCNNSFCRVKFPNCLKHNISIEMSNQPINDEWWVYIIMDPHHSNSIFCPMDPHYSNNIFNPMKLGTNSPSLCHQKMHFFVPWIPIIVITFLIPWNWAQTAQVCVIRKCTSFFSEHEEHTETLYHIPKWNWYLIYFSWIALIQEMST